VSRREPGGERERLALRVRELESENRQLTARCLAAEMRQESWLAQYVSTVRLHSSLRRREVLTALEEIVASLVGCEEAALYERSADTLRPVAGFGIDLGRLEVVRIGEGLIGRAAAERRVYMAPSGATSEAAVTACVPLVLDGRLTGALALFRLLAQKPSLNHGDRQLLELLSTHAAVALEASSAAGQAS